MAGTTRIVDLHMHSVESDGGLTARELIRRAKRLNLSAISITDHNTVAAAKESLAIAPQYGLEAITGIELDSGWNGIDWHIMCYGFDPDNKQMNEALAQVREERVARAKEFVTKLREIGFDIDFEQVVNTGSSIFTTYHVLKALMEKPANREKVYAEVGPGPDVHDVVEHYMIEGKPAFVPKKEIPIEQVFQMIKNAGGVTSCGHPGLNHADWDENFDTDNYILQLKSDYGLDGIEAISPKHTQMEIEHYHKLAEDNGMLVTGGSDFHGVVIKGLRIERQPMVPYQYLDNIKARLTERGGHGIAKKT